ncbi:MAG: amidohydrolase family protein [Ardenticatenaceae bacterium]|nr:amidohydrolase family protein [Anaerolineales bacterium]MCB8937314.1 amidohydrolase family protein [Ardenticatenaceae bacterium]MCB8975492.1 amidohydrolase family protein [Ardenticatenaceae bacterium]
MDLLIRNIGQIVSGNINAPLVEGDAVLVKDGRITAVSHENSLNVSNVERIIDANGCTLFPGLIDSHVHVVVGDFTPRQQTLGFIESCLHGGVTSMISAGEVHIDGRPKNPVGLKALAIIAAQSFANARPAGVKVQGGGLILDPAFTEQDFKEVAEAGVKHLGEIGLGTVTDWALAGKMVGWAHKYGLKVMMHVGGASIPGSNVIGADAVLTAKPDVASHLNGGPTAAPLAEVKRIITESNIALELVQCGNMLALQNVARLIHRHDALDRLIIGTDMPSGTGVVPLGMLRTITAVTTFSDIRPEQAVAMATGNTASVYELRRGLIAEGYEADFLLVDAPVGSVAKDALEALAVGDIPGIAAVFIDGALKIGVSRNTPPPKRKATL